MNLAPYVDVEFEDTEAMQQFAFVHLLAHNSIAEYLADQNLSIDNFPIDNMENQEDWMFQHMQTHIVIAQRLGLDAPQDLEVYDLQDKQQFYDWHALHAGEHDRILLAIGF